MRAEPGPRSHPDTPRLARRLREAEARVRAEHEGRPPRCAGITEAERSQ